MAPSKTTRDSRKKCAVQATKTRCTIVQTAQEAWASLAGKLEENQQNRSSSPLEPARPS
jgi:hypothetical protein